VKVFLDTNVLVAAFATRGLCADVLRSVLTEHELLLSDTVLRELNRALIRKVRVPDAVARDVAAFLRASATLASVRASVPVSSIRDPDDAVILGEAIAMGADVFVTGDRDLLDAKEIARIEILDPRGFWGLMGGVKR